MVEDRKTEIESILLYDFLKSRSEPINYVEKYNIALSLLELRRRNEAVRKIEKLKEELEKNCGYHLHTLQDTLLIAYAKGDLDTKYYARGKKIFKAFYLRNQLEEFRKELTEIVIKELCKGGVFFG